MDNLVKVSLQLEPQIAKALDEWQRQRFVRSRSSAANQLLAQALGLAAQPQPPISSPPQVSAMPTVAPAIPTSGSTINGWGQS